MDGLNTKKELLDDERVVFVPVGEILAIESIYDKMEQAQQEFRKVAEGMKAVESFKS